MSRPEAPWLTAAREVCRKEGIPIAAWGANLLTVEAKTPDRAREIASILSPLGLRVVDDEDDASAGLLSLSPNPEAIAAAQREFMSRYGDFSRRPVIDLLTPPFELLLSLGCIWLGATATRPRAWVVLFALGSILFLLFLWDGCRIWGWKLENGADELRVRRCFRWSAIPWPQIHAVETSTGAGRNQEKVTIKVSPRTSLTLGTFGFPFARALRDYLRASMKAR